MLAFFLTSLLLVSPVTGAQTANKIPVFVTSAAGAEGFTDPSKDRQDSVKDLLNKLKDSKTLQAVTSETDAVLRLEVLDRETRRETNVWGRQNKSYLTVRLTAGTYTTEFTGESVQRDPQRLWGRRRQSRRAA
jgi:hypothetical protein